jgi:hypothetical protein
MSALVKAYPVLIAEATIRVENEASLVAIRDDQLKPKEVRQT